MNPSAPTVIDLRCTDLTSEGFAPFGTVIPPLDDGTPFGPHDAELDLTQGTPRFYTMRIPGRPTDASAPAGPVSFAITHITHHRRVTQTLASAGGYEWFLAVAPPVDLADPADGPDISEIRAFRVAGDTAITLHTGTWHAGPLFVGPSRSFFNLELSDTNITDHHTCDLVEERGVKLTVLAP